MISEDFWDACTFSLGLTASMISSCMSGLSYVLFKKEELEPSRDGENCSWKIMGTVGLLSSAALDLVGLALLPVSTQSVTAVFSITSMSVCGMIFLNITPTKPEIIGFCAITLLSAGAILTGNMNTHADFAMAIADNFVEENVIAAIVIFSISLLAMCFLYFLSDLKSMVSQVSFTCLTSGLNAFVNISAKVFCGEFTRMAQGEPRSLFYIITPVLSIFVMIYYCCVSKLMGQSNLLLTVPLYQTLGITLPMLFGIFAANESPSNAIGFAIVIVLLLTTNFMNAVYQVKREESVAEKSDASVEALKGNKNTMMGAEEKIDKFGANMSTLPVMTL